MKYKDREVISVYLRKEELELVRSIWGGRFFRGQNGPGPLFRRALVQLALREYPEAAEHYRQSISDDPARLFEVGLWEAPKAAQ